MFNDLVYRLRALVKGKALERELDDELRFHVEQQAEKYGRAGASPAEANRMARVSLQGTGPDKGSLPGCAGNFLVGNDHSRFAL